ncbi:hypothetical protein [Bacillus horti]|uniref:Uncharacterized protein n=1 Tax=Caldalkalibacillus horti TaxID=77523 RepID=A0ABT9VX23_9BACI|nr:hypothetical protein [Bacillus horti]MDQ0165524.1 hypothetical protein [Bacillus horti]
MLFAKKRGYHCLVLFIQGEKPHPYLIISPSEVAADVLSTMKKLESSPLNSEDYLGSLAPFAIVQEIQGLSKIQIHNDSLSWSEPILYTDYAKKVGDRLQGFMSEDENVNEDLIYFIGEFTMMQDNGFLAPF